MSNSELFVERPWVFFFLIPAIALVVIAFLFLTHRRKTLGKMIALFCRCAAIALIFAILAGLGFSRSTNEQAVVLVMDFSDSTTGVRDKILADSARIEELIGDDTPVRVVAFGGGQAYELEKDANGRYTVAEATADSTDIGQALEFAASLLPDDHAKRIVLFSDGKETNGSAQKAARVLKNMGVRVDTVYYNTELLSVSEVQLTSIGAPESVKAGDQVKLNVRIDSVNACKATLELTDNGQTTQQVELEIEPGINNFEIFCPAEEAGVHIYKATLYPDGDALPTNNERWISVSALGESRILIIAGYINEAYYLQRLLKTAGQYDTVDLKTTVTAPKTISDLCRYDQIILMNVNADDLSVSYIDMLEDYVAVYGKSLLTIGGNDTYTVGNMQGTDFEELLPITFEYTREETDTTVALMLVIDSSQSMEIYNPDVFFYAKVSAEQCLDAVSEADYVGVISFNADAQVEFDIAHATEQNKADCTEAIWNIVTEHGTHYSSALNLAYDELMAVDADVKHVIFLSDGEPRNDSGYSRAAEKLSSAGITVSTIGLMGGSSFNPTALEKVADIGNGNFYEVLDEEDLPSLMLSEAKSLTSKPLVLEESKVYIPYVSAETKGISESDLHTINGYIGTTAKEDADLLLTVGRGDPLLAKWDFGKGVVSSFMTDAGYLWTASWKDDEKCNKLLVGMSSVIFSQSGRSSSIMMDVAENGTVLHVTAETAMTGFAGMPELKVASGETETVYSMTQAGKYLYACDVPVENEGALHFTVTLYDMDHRIIEKDDLVYAVSYSPEYDAFAGGGNAVLSEIALLTGGRSVEGVGVSGQTPVTPGGQDNTVTPENAVPSESGEPTVNSAIETGENAESDKIALLAEAEEADGGENVGTDDPAQTPDTPEAVETPETAETPAEQQTSAPKEKIAALESLADADMGTVTYRDYIVLPLAAGACALLLLDVLLRVLKFKSIKRFFENRKRQKQTEQA